MCPEANSIFYLIEPSKKECKCTHVTLDGRTVMTFIGSFIIFGISHKEVYYLDALFISTSSVCITGLYTVPLQSISIPSQVIILLLTIVGGLPFTTLPLQIYKLIKHYRLWKKWEGERVSSHRRESKDEQVCVDEMIFKSKLLILIVVLSTFFVVVMAFFIIVGIYLQLSYSVLNGLSPWWFALFLAIAGFNNVGYSFYSGPFTLDVFMNIAIILLVTIGNCYFPFVIWSIIKTMKRICSCIPRLKNSLGDVCEFALNNHHHLSLHLFPALQTRLFMFVNIFILIVGTFTTLGLEYNNEILAQYNGGQRFMIMLFQAVNTRSSGFGTVDYTRFSNATLIVYIIMMRIKPQMWCNLEEGVYNIQNINEKEDIRRSKRIMGFLPPFPPPQRVNTATIVTSTSVHSSLSALDDEQKIPYIYNFFKRLKRKFDAIFKKSTAEHNLSLVSKLCLDYFDCIYYNCCRKLLVG
ncbi:hypothetical protein AKO1_007930 [Acrasis kona]|uniref:Uncharacterized protein n=1 Tax=Acrasis kona TaxID=1008807 RepID=A0AAW2YQD4_9EUKA